MSINSFKSATLCLVCAMIALSCFNTIESVHSAAVNQKCTNMKHFCYSLEQAYNKGSGDIVFHVESEGKDCYCELNPKVFTPSRIGSSNRPAKLRSPQGKIGEYKVDERLHDDCAHIKPVCYTLMAVFEEAELSVDSKGRCYCNLPEQFTLQGPWLETVFH
eukprot:Nk52_evm8s152 gene=Nk52_evmTU8s152